MTPDHFVIRVPRLAGYKTLVVNAVIALAALAVAVWPELPGEAVTPESVGAWFDQFTGVVVAGVAAVNMALRLMSSTPAAPFKRASGDPGAGGADYDRGYAAGVRDQWRNRVDMGAARGRTLGEALADERIAGSDVLTDSWPPLAEVKNDLMVWGTPCTWPDCACHIRCADRQPPSARLEEANGDLARKLAFMDTLTSGPGVRAFLTAFLTPSLVLFGGLTLATLSGCADSRKAARDAGQTLEWNCGGVQSCIDALRRERGL